MNIELRPVTQHSFYYVIQKNSDSSFAANTNHSLCMEQLENIEYTIIEHLRRVWIIALPGERCVIYKKGNLFLKGAGGIQGPDSKTRWTYRFFAIM